MDVMNQKALNVSSFGRCHPSLRDVLVIGLWREAATAGSGYSEADTRRQHEIEICVNRYTLLYSRNKWVTKKLILYYKKFACFMYGYMYPYVCICVNLCTYIHLCLCLYLYMNCWALGRSSRFEETEAVWGKDRQESRCLPATLVMSGSPYRISRVCAFLRST